MNRIEKFVKVNDYWYPNFENDTVKVTLIHTKYGKYDHVNICVWGADDFGLEMYFKGTLEESKLKFNEWKENIYDQIPEVCNEKYFRNLGFYNA